MRLSSPLYKAVYETPRSHTKHKTRKKAVQFISRVKYPRPKLELTQLENEQEYQSRTYLLLMIMIKKTDGTFKEAARARRNHYL